MDLNDDIFKKAIEKWGVRSQMDVAVEEMGELIVDIMHMRRNKVNLEKLMEEVVDVSIMMKQLRYLDEELFEKIYKQKVNHIVKRIMK